MIMIESSVIYLFLGAATCVIGAVPLGLVNLSVVQVSASTNIQKSMPLAFGAALVEILFALFALFAGSLFKDVLTQSIGVKVIIMVVFLLAGIYFLYKKEVKVYQNLKRNSSGFFVGVLLNLFSIQVLLFWVLTITFLSVRNFLPTSVGQIILFISGIWIAKLSVLRIYALLAKRVLAKSEIVSQNINRIIGVMLIVIALLQLLKI